jgi:DNA-binding LytR/AlgR family response regulator
MIRCIALDDEYLALEVIKNYVDRLPFLKLVETFIDPVVCYSYLTTAEPDVIFLDVDMPDLSGIELIRSLQNPPLIIFTTAYAHFATEAFELDAIDYLIKPVPFERFLKAVQKAQKLLTDRGKKNDQTYLFIKSEHKTVRIDYDDILYVEGKKDFISIQTRSAEIPTSLTLSSIIEILPPTNFIRVHRSFLVAINKISSVEYNHVHIGNVRISIGDKFRDELKKRIS